jgi:hypothetical protein
LLLGFNFYCLSSNLLGCILLWQERLCGIGSRTRHKNLGVGLEVHGRKLPLSGAESPNVGLPILSWECLFTRRVILRTRVGIPRKQHILSLGGEAGGIGPSSSTRFERILVAVIGSRTDIGVLTAPIMLVINTVLSGSKKL